MVRKATATRKAYEAPVIFVLGTLHELTLDTKVGAHCDITCYHHGSH
jgi:hypothetical protein